MMLVALLLASVTATAAIPGQTTCATVQGVVLGLGNDLGQAIAKTQGECCSACQAKPQCRSWTYHPKGSSCWLHGSIGPTKKEDNTISGVPGGKMPPIPPPSPPHHHGGGGSPMGGWSGPEACSPGTNGTTLKFCDHTLPLDARLDDLIGRVEVDEIALELTARQSEPLDRIGVPSYYWGTNAIHGMQNVQCLPAAHGGKCPTSFAAPVTLAAAFNMSLVKDMGNVIGRELRGYYNAKIHNSLDTWSPTININRDPRWVSFDQSRVFCWMHCNCTAFTGAQRRVSWGRSASGRLLWKRVHPRPAAVHGRRGGRAGGRHAEALLCV